MIYSFPELRSILHVGDVVRTVAGKPSPCRLLNNDGSNTEKITEVNDRYFAISKCTHYFCEDNFLEIVERDGKPYVPEETTSTVALPPNTENRTTITWDTLQVGDKVTNNSITATIIHKLADNLFLAVYDNSDVAEYILPKQIERGYWEIIQPEQTKRTFTK